MKYSVIVVIGVLFLMGCDEGLIGAGGVSRSDGGVDPAADGFVGSTGQQPQAETCNGFDDDLDGEVDEGCGCTAGKTQPCFPGTAGQLKGLCKKGTQTCAGTTEFGVWGDCKGAVTPQKEICDDKIDQDCDGADLLCTQPPEKTKVTCDGFIFGQNARPVDIVWAIDQSGSMDGEIKMVRQNMNAFAAHISSAKADYRVSLLASRYIDTDNNQICIPQPLAGPSCADSTRFKQISQHVDSHDALVKLMANIGPLESFMRPNSVRHFVVVTDDKAKGASWLTFHAFLKARPGYSDYVFHSIVALVDKGCAADEGKDYVALSTVTGGLKFHICSANWTSLFQQLGKVVISATTKFMLKLKPTSTLTVTYDGKPTTQGTQWTHDKKVNQIILKGPLPADGTKIKVCYSY